jgi:hypothetical protein
MLQKSLWNTIITATAATATTSDVMISFVLALFPPITTTSSSSAVALSFHPMCSDLKRIIGPTWFFVHKKQQQEEEEEKDVSSLCHWFQLLDKTTNDTTSSSSAAVATTTKITTEQRRLVQLAVKLCNGCEDNKKAFVQAGIRYHSNDNSHSGLELLVSCIPSSIDAGCEDSMENTTTEYLLIEDVCQLVAILCKFQPLAEPEKGSSSAAAAARGGEEQAPLVSSAHANVKEFHRANAVPTLHRIAKQCLVIYKNNNQNIRISQDDEQHDHNTSMLCDSLAALRTMAIDNDIVQNMIALGILDTVHDALDVIVDKSSSSSSSSSTTSLLPLATATFGLIRNLCANDEVKTTICMSSLPSILLVMQKFLLTQQEDKDNNSSGTTTSNAAATTTNKRKNGCAILQEHACGILAAMALRQPQNAQAIIATRRGNDDSTNTNSLDGGHVLILEAMKAFPEKVALQRQGCLALRNIASRLSDTEKSMILEADVEDVLQNIAGRHPASSEEAYAALRDLGCNPTIYKLDEFGNATKSTTQMFGKIESNFRPVYE